MKVLLGLLISTSGWASPATLWSELLRTHVKAGRVDYAGMERDRAQLDKYLSWVAAASEAQEMAFYLDAYNALVVRSVLSHKTPARVLDVKGFFDAIQHTVAGKPRTLNELETFVRKKWNDARIHFALNCAARSCPPLFGEAFATVDVEKTLSMLTSTFLNGPGVRVNDAKKEIAVSKLFEWYGDDFARKPKTAADYLKTWLTEPRRKAAMEAGYKIVFQDYDWTLNDR